MDDGLNSQSNDIVLLTDEQRAGDTAALLLPATRECAADGTAGHGRELLPAGGVGTAGRTGRLRSGTTPSRLLRYAALLPSMGKRIRTHHPHTPSASLISLSLSLSLSLTVFRL